MLENTRFFAFLWSLPVVRNVWIELAAGYPRSAVNRAGDRGAVVVFIAPEYLFDAPFEVELERFLFDLGVNDFLLGKDGRDIAD